MRKKIVLSLLLVPTLLSAGARRPADIIPDATSDSITWINDGDVSGFDTRVYNGEQYITVETLARLSHAQMRWQTVSQQACLSRNTGLICFNWDRSQVFFNGNVVRGQEYELEYEDNQLYIPLRFVTSKAFDKFSAQKFTWNAQLKRLTQTEPVTISIPAIENMDDRYQLALTIQRKIPYHMLENSKERIWIRFVRGQTEGSQILEGDDVIEEIKVIQHRHAADLLIKLGPAVTSHDVYFDQGTRKLTVDVFKNEIKAAAPQVKKISPPSSIELPVPPVAALRKKSPNAPKQNGNQDAWTVVIDAGHGGLDPGAIGSRGTFEKDVNLKLAKELGEVMERNKNFRVVLTRTKDEFMTLSERTMIANRVHADVFISVHCNSSLSVKHTGFEVYILSPEASDQAAAAVARVENSVVSLEAKKGENGSRLSELLASMAVYNTINESSKFAGYLCRGVKKRSAIDQASVKEANFHVLRGAQMPGVLIELGYLSHPVSELQLRSSRYLNQMAKGLAEGLMMYQQSLGRKRQSITNQQNKQDKRASK